MGLRGPQRKPGSQRWKSELKKKLALANKDAQVDAVVAIAAPSDLPACPRSLPRSVADKWQALLLDMVAAGVQVKQIDARCIAIAARYEDALERWDSICSRDDIEPEVLVSALRSQQASMKEYLAALEKIGGTPLVRMRAHIAPEDKSPKKDNDPWGDL